MKKPVLINSMAALVMVFAILVGIYLNQVPTKPVPVDDQAKNLQAKSVKAKSVQTKSEQDKSVLATKIQVNEDKSPIQYRIKAGDSLYTLAKQYQTTINSIMFLNKLTTDKLAIDQELMIPRVKLVLPKDYHPLAVVETKTPASTPVVTRLAVASVSRGTVHTGAQLIEWSKVNPLFARGMIATVTDVDTGLTFKVIRNRGHNHADVDPLTAEDTATMKKIYGGQWSWARRAIVVEIKGQRIAASMNGMPHGEPIITDNNFPGHFCIHFLGSMTHGSEYTKTHKPLVDPQHQAMVRKAAGK